MEKYYAYGLIIESEIPLSNKINTTKKPNITVKFTDLSREDPEIINSSQSNCLLGRLPGIACFLIREGREILVDPEPGVVESVLSPCIVGSAMAVLLQQRGYLVLHASCVVIDGVAVAFLGHSGSGKSTICSAFHYHNHQILTDDVMVVHLEGDKIEVIPSVPEIKLRSDSASILGYQEGILSPLHPLTKKKVHRITEGFDRKPVPLKQIYLLEKGQENKVQNLSKQEAFIELICHTRAVKTLRSQNLERVHFQKCTKIAQNIPMSKLIRKFSLSELSNVINMVKRDVRDNNLKQNNQQKLIVKT